MDINKMLAELRTERENLEQASVTFERLAAGRGQTPAPPANRNDGTQASRPATGSKNKAKAQHQPRFEPVMCV
jgi:hypothetical protein